MELQKLHRIIRQYADNGMSFLYIAPHYEEVKRICDRTAVMQNGQIIKYFQASEHIPDTYMYRWTEGFDRRVREQIAKKADSGTMWIGHETFRQKPDRRIAVIQEVPVQTMLFSNLSYLDNLCFTLDHRFHDIWLRNKIKKV